VFTYSLVMVLSAWFATQMQALRLHSEGWGLQKIGKKVGVSHVYRPPSDPERYKSPAGRMTLTP